MIVRSIFGGPAGTQAAGPAIIGHLAASCIGWLAAGRGRGWLPTCTTRQLQWLAGRSTLYLLVCLQYPFTMRHTARVPRLLSMRTAALGLGGGAAVLAATAGVSSSSSGGGGGGRRAAASPAVAATQDVHANPAFEPYLPRADLTAHLEWQTWHISV
jgi:hypothetical protein